MYFKIVLSLKTPGLNNQIQHFTVFERVLSHSEENNDLFNSRGASRPDYLWHNDRQIPNKTLDAL